MLTASTTGLLAWKLLHVNRTDPLQQNHDPTVWSTDVIDPVIPGAQIVQWSYSDLFVAITGNIWAVPNVTSTKIFDGKLRILFSTTIGGSCGS